MIIYHYKMKIKKLMIKLKNMWQYFAFAFYPKTTLIACAAFFAVVIGMLSFVMGCFPHDSARYNIAFALTTGAAGSFFVSFVIELTNNYRHNMLAWHELHEFYSVVVDYETYKQVLMQNMPHQKAEKKAYDEFIATGGVEDIDDDVPKDIIQSTWEQLPKIIPIFKRTLDDKKSYLSEVEINELKNIVLFYYTQIRNEVLMRMIRSPLYHNVINHPDEDILSYPRNILEDMPDWIREQIARMENQKALDRLTDTILSDEFLLTYFMKDYDISQRGMDNYHSPFDYEEYELPEFDDDEEYDYSEQEDEEEFKALHNQLNLEMEEEDKPFASWHISSCCKDIADSIDILEQSILKKPYYGMILAYDRKASKESIDGSVSSVAYDLEKKRLEKKLKRQQNC